MSGGGGGRQASRTRDMIKTPRENEETADKLHVTGSSARLARGLRTANYYMEDNTHLTHKDAKKNTEKI